MPRRAGAWNRAELRNGAIAWALDNWFVLAGFVGLMAAALALQWLSLEGFWRGFATGAVVTFGAGFIVVAGVVGSGQLHRFFGMSGESSTAKLLGTRRRRRQGWSVVNGLQLGRHEIDHIVIGPGGVLAIETKWTNVPWRVEQGHLRGPLGNPVAQTQRSAKQVSALLNGPTCGRLDVPVDPVLIIWGPGSPRLVKAVVEIDGVPVYSARDLSGLQRRLDAQVLEESRWRGAQAALRAYAESQEAVLG